MRKNSAAGSRILTGLIITLTVLVFRPGLSYSETASYPTGKHDEKIETWSFHSKLDLPEKDGALYMGMFFCAGSLYFLKGNFAHIFWLDTSTGEYSYENNIFIPPIEKVVHCDKELNEKYHDSFFRYNAEKNTVLTHASFKELSARLTFVPQKAPLYFDYVNPDEMTEKTFDWYMFPQMNIKAVLNNGYDLRTSGKGFFQHFWGEKVYESGDFLVAHLNSGYNIIVNDIMLSKDGTPLMPEKYEYILISDPDGNVEKISSFEYSVHTWAESGNKGKKYPAHMSVGSSQRNLELDIRVFKKDQTANLLGVEKWFGYAAVTGQIDDSPQKGWAFFSPIGIKD
jgi:hypothetical protein